MKKIGPQLGTMVALGTILVAGGVSSADVGVLDEEPARRILLKLAPDTVVQVDARGGRWILPDPTRSRLRLEDLVAATVLHDIMLEAGLQSLEPLLSREASDDEAARETGIDRWTVATFEDAAVLDRLEEIVPDVRSIERVEIDGLGGVSAGIPSDTWFGLQYGMRNVGQNIAGVDGVAGADVDPIPAWDWTTGSEDIVVAVLDSGIDQHEEFADRFLPGWNVPDQTESFADECNSHGTHVTGILGAEGDNGDGIAGVSWGCRILPVVVVDGCTGFESWVAGGIVWAADQGADIINMSLQYSAGGQALADAVAYADALGVIQVAAAGNSGAADDVQAPARFPQTIAVAATDNRDEHWSSSSSGPEIDLAAPGWRIYSAAGTTNYVYKSGTSMAAPFVTGALVLMKSAVPGLDVATARAALVSTAEDVMAPGWDELTGAGRLDVTAALLSLDPEPPAAGDLDRNGRVDGEDFGIMLSQWGPCAADCEDVCDADLNGDCVVNGEDLGLLFIDWTG